MFAKPFKTSGNSLLKNKDAKKIRKDLINLFEDTCTEEKLLELISNKATLKKVSFQAPSRTVIYLIEETQEPILFDISGKGDYCFTVYALWKVADLLPPLVVHAPVSEFVMNGADVMLPGVILTMEIAKSLLKGQKRCVYANGNPMPFAVGEICTDLAEIEKFGKKGKALKLLHVFGDELYKMGPQSVPNEGFLPTRIIRLDISSTAQDENDTCSNDGILLQQQQQQQQQENKEEKIDLGDLKIIIEKETCLPPAVPVNMGTSIDKEHIDGNIEMTKEKMDFLVEKTFLQALKTRVKTKQLPMLASTFQSTILLPSRPVGTNLNFKQSTYKKLSVFLKQMETKGLVQVSEKDGIQSIVSICRSHPDVIHHEKYETEEDATQAKALSKVIGSSSCFAAGFGSSAGGAQRGGERNFAPEVIEIYMVPPLLNDILVLSQKEAVLQQSNKYFYASFQIRDAFFSYLEKEQLEDQLDKKFIHMNGPLTDVVFGCKTKSSFSPLLQGYPNRMARPDLFTKILQKCLKYHIIKFFPTHEPKAVSGECKKIQIRATKGKRQNNTITFVAFYQSFGIDGETFVKEAQKKFGCSATLQESNDKKKGMEIMVQGQMVQEILDYLVFKYKIPLKYCESIYEKGVKAKKK